MNKKFEELTTKDICSYIAIINAMCDEGILNIDLEKTKATIYVDRLTKYLENQNVMLQNIIDKAIEYIENNGHGYDITGDGYYSLDEDEQKELLEILKGDTNE